MLSLDVVVCLQRPMDEGGDCKFQFFAKLLIPPQVAGVVGILNYCAFFLI